MCALKTAFPHCVALLLLPIAPLFCLPLELTGKVVDETNQVVAGVRLTLSGRGLAAPLVEVSDEGGRFHFPSVSAGSYELRAEKPGYYATISRALEISDPGFVEVVMNHRREFEETVSVVYSAPAIDRHEASRATSLTAEQLTDLPFVSTHDFRNSLALIPGMIKDQKGRMHMNGGGEEQVYYSLDGFNVTSPASGILENRISVDAIRSLRIETGRYSAEYGKGSAGVMALESSQGDDRLRFSATNFMPSFELKRGLVLSNWTPRATASGPILRGRAWFFDALDIQYERNVIQQLPPREDTNTNWFGSNYLRVQVNLTSKNILSSGFLFNLRNSRHFGISPLDPVETSRNLHERFYFFSLKDQAVVGGGWIVETGIALNRLDAREAPLGTALYVIRPQGRSGNYFVESQKQVSRIQALASALTPIWNWHGRHSFKMGIDANAVHFEKLSRRRPYQVLTAEGSLARLVAFRGNAGLDRNNAEFSGYFQDRWTLGERLFVEAGMRIDGDRILRGPLWSPRLAFTWAPPYFADAKFSAGMGVSYDATNLSLLTRALDQQRLDTFFDEKSAPIGGGPVTSTFVADERSLKAPFYLNWSLGWQQKLRGNFYLEGDFVRKNGRHNWAYDVAPRSGPPSSSYFYLLGASRQDRYYCTEIGLSRTFKGKYPWLLSYARSSAHTSAAVDFSLENPVFSRQSAGPMDWDAPNRLISWATLPLPGFNKYLLAYFFEWHSGLPWSEVNKLQQLVGLPNARRFPEYFNLNLHVERRIRMWRCEWALRAGFNNLTGHNNPTVVSNNLDAADYGAFTGSQGRVFTGRIRFLGKN